MLLPLNSRVPCQRLSWACRSIVSAMPRNWHRMDFWRYRPIAPFFSRVDGACRERRPADENATGPAPACAPATQIKTEWGYATERRSHRKAPRKDGHKKHEETQRRDSFLAAFCVFAANSSPCLVVSFFVSSNDFERSSPERMQGGIPSISLHLWIPPRYNAGVRTAKCCCTASKRMSHGQ